MKKSLLRIILSAGFIFSCFGLSFSQVVPIFSVRISEDYKNATLLGGVENGKWLDRKTTFGKLKGDGKLTLFNFDTGSKEEISFGTLKTCGEFCDEGFCFEPQTKFSAEFGIGTNAKWNAMPRLPKKLAANDPKVVKIVADFLKIKGLSKKKPKIEKAFRIDVDGDGIKEIIVLANHYELDANALPKLGNYSFLLMQKTVKRKSQTIMIDGDYLAKNRDSDGSELRLSALGDLNGDGKMEFIVDTTAYNGEENWTKVIEMKSGKPSEVKVLHNYCGV